MDLFLFSMQQLSPNPLRLGTGDLQTVGSYLRHWLHRYHRLDELPRLQGGATSSQPQLDAVAWNELLDDAAEFYGLPFPSRCLPIPTTIAAVEAYVQEQMLKLAA